MGQFEPIRQDGKRKLKMGAVPTLFPDQENATPKKKSRVRRATRPLGDITNHIPLKQFIASPPAIQSPPPSAVEVCVVLTIYQDLSTVVLLTLFSLQIITNFSPYSPAQTSPDSSISIIHDIIGRPFSSTPVRNNNIITVVSFVVNFRILCRLHCTVLVTILFSYRCMLP